MQRSTPPDLMSPLMGHLILTQERASEIIIYFCTRTKIMHSDQSYSCLVVMYGIYLEGLAYLNMLFTAKKEPYESYECICIICVKILVEFVS